MPKVERPPCGLSWRDRCECEWHAEDDMIARETRWWHGDNPEHTKAISHHEQRQTGMCDKGHALILERWMTDVIAYEHPAAPQGEKE